MSEPLHRASPDGLPPPITAAGLEGHHPTGSRLLRAEYGGPSLGLQHWRLPPGRLLAPPVECHVVSIHILGRASLQRRLAGERARSGLSRRGHFTLTPAGHDAVWQWDQPVEVANLFVPTRTIDAVLEEAGCDPARCQLVDAVARPDPLLLELGRMLLAQASEAAGAAGLLRETTACLIAHRLVGSYSTLAPAPPRGGGLSGRRLQRVLDCMHAHIVEGVGLAALANLAGLGERQFLRAFRLAMGVPPHAYLIRVRMEHACVLLRDTAMPAAEVAAACGYTQPGHFSTAFRTVMGCTPSSYRREAGR